MNDSTSRGPSKSSADDEAFARLQAADPAAGIEPSAGFSERVISAATDAPDVVDLGAERARRRPLWQTLVGAAAAVAIVGGAGFGIGASGLGSPASTTAGAPISLGSNGHLEVSSDMVEGPKIGPISGQSGSRDMIYPGFGGRFSYTSSGLSTEAGTANGFGFDARSASNTETIAALAAALGVEGTPELRDGAWFVGPQDGSAPSLYVSLDGVLSFSYSNPAINPWQCDANGVCAEPTPAPGEESAVSTLRDLLGKLGFDVNNFELTSQTWEGSATTQASAWRVVDGQRSDQSITVEIAEAGIVTVYGGLASVVELGEYSIVSEQEAFERLSDRRFGGYMTGNPEILRMDTSVQDWVPPTEPPATPAPGASVSWSVTDVHIVSARLGLASQWQPDGTVLLVPAYELTDDEGGTWSVIAVADSHLDFATQ